MRDQSDQTEDFRRWYGGSDRAAPSLNRLIYVKANSISKARDLGPVVFLDQIITGELGSQVGSNTVFLKATISQASRIGVRNLDTNKYQTKYIGLGVLSADLRPIPLNDQGFALSSEPNRKPALTPEGRERQAQVFPEGEFYFTITSSSFSAIPYKVALIVEPVGYMEGLAQGVLTVFGRIGLIKLQGLAIGQQEATGTLQPVALIGRLSGEALGSSDAVVTMFIPRGSAFCQDLTEGRLQMNYRIEGAAEGQALPTATAAPVRRMSGTSTSESLNLGELTIPQGGYG